MLKGSGTSNVEFTTASGTLSYTKDLTLTTCASIKAGVGASNCQNVSSIVFTKEFATTSTTAFNIAASSSSTVAYDRSFTTDQASTVCLPFALTQDEADEAGAFYAFTGESSGTLTFTKVTSGGTTAYTPYIFVPSKATPFASLTGKAIVASSTFTTNGTVTKNGYTFKGTLAQQTVASGAYGFSGGTFKKAGSGVSIKAFRAYITSSGGNAPSILDIDFGDGSGTTGISTVESEKQEDDVMYNLQGQRVSGGHKGLVIKNGRKYFAK